VTATSATTRTGFLRPSIRQLPKKPNYDFEKRRKEQDRKQKKDAKREERLLRKRGEVTPDGESDEGGAPIEGEDEVTAGE
jgi:hypothetical protein